jgi:predicted DNA-binding protein with PD1-like motif
MKVSECSVKKVLVGTLREGEDLLASLQKLIEEQGVKSGRIEVIGAVSEAKVGFYNYKTEEYEYSKYRRTMNIVSCIGTVNHREGTPSVHLHISLADHDGGMYGGHLTEGTTVLSSEFNLAVYE